MYQLSRYFKSQKNGFYDGSASGTVFPDYSGGPKVDPAASPSSKSRFGERKVLKVTSGRTTGPITRLISPSDLGEVLKPFVFLDLFESDSSHLAELSVHPVAARLVDAACFARDGDLEAAKACIAHAVTLLREEPSTIPAIRRPLERSALKAVRGGLAAWQKRRLIAYIDTHFARRIRSENLATLLDFSVGHFCRAFKSTFGLSPHDYLMRRRVEAAQGLMLATSEPLAAIAVSCGMSDQSHFTRCFRRIVGETPQQWRRARRGALEDHATELAYPSANQHLFDTETSP